MLKAKKNFRSRLDVLHIKRVLILKTAINLMQLKFVCSFLASAVSGDCSELGFRLPIFLSWFHKKIKLKLKSRSIKRVMQILMQTLVFIEKG